MDLSFHRSLTMSMKVGKPEEIRAFVFDVAIGVTKSSPVPDPLSGMLINLIQVEDILKKLKDFWTGLAQVPSFKSLLQESHKFVNPLVQAEGASLHELLLQEKRGFFLGWRKGHFFMGQEEIIEVDEELYRLKTECLFEETQLFQMFAIFSKEELESGVLFKAYPTLRLLEVENLASGERFELRVP